MPQEPAFSFLGLSVQERVATVIMNRPPVNAVSQEMYAEIRDLFGDFDHLLPDVSVVILTSAGRHFCGGNDLDEFASLSPRTSPGRMRLVRDAFTAIYDCPVPTIGAVRGVALGTGLAIAASCDLLVCADTARFGVPEVGVGVMGGAKHLARLVPQSVVRLMYLTAEPIGVAELARHGGIAAIVPEDRLIDEATTLATHIASHSAAALRHAKESLNAIEFMDLKAGYEREQQLTARLSGMADAREALTAYREKRPAIFSQQWTAGW
jgi:enoyl-CoA hydratase